MKLKVTYNKNCTVFGRFDVYHVSKKTTIIDVWKLSFWIVKG